MLHSHLDFFVFNVLGKTFQNSFLSKTGKQFAPLILLICTLFFCCHELELTEEIKAFPGPGSMIAMGFTT